MKIVLKRASIFGSNAGRNVAADAGLHMQSKAENDRHIEQLKDDYERKHPVKLSANAGVTARRMAEQEQKAKAYAVRMEPHTFLPFLARRTNGIAADQTQRTVRGVRTNPSSSWIKSISTTANGAPIIVETKSGKKYACPCPWDTAEDILRSPSVGAEVGSRLFIRKFKIGKIGTKNQGKIVAKVNGRVAKIRGM